MYSDLDQQEGLLSTYYVDTVITIELTCVYVESFFSTNCYYYETREKKTTVEKNQINSIRLCGAREIIL